MEPKEVFLDIDSYSLRTHIFGEITADKPVIVLLHGGLDCLEMWRSFPKKMAEETGLTVVVYERFGHGKSGVLTEQRGREYRHHEALEVLPAVLKALNLNKVILAGHSDGGAMALIAAGSLPNIVGVYSIAPPLVVEPFVCEGIREAINEYENGTLASKLKVFHGDATDALFYGWAKPWLSDAFIGWSCSDDLKNITCPVHLVFGKADDYGYKPSLEVLLENLKDAPDLTLIEGAGHMPHHTAKKETIDSIVRLSQKVAG